MHVDTLSYVFGAVSGWLTGAIGISVVAILVNHRKEK